MKTPLDFGVHSLASCCETLPIGGEFIAVLPSVKVVCYFIGVNSAMIVAFPLSGFDSLAFCVRGERRSIEQRLAQLFCGSDSPYIVL